MRIALPKNIRKKGFWGLFREVWKFSGKDGNMFQIKISTELSNTSNLYITLDEDEAKELNNQLTEELNKKI